MGGKENNNTPPPPINKIKANLFSTCRPSHKSFSCPVPVREALFVPLFGCLSFIVLDNACVQPDAIGLFSHFLKIKGVSFQESKS